MDDACEVGCLLFELHGHFWLVVPRARETGGYSVSAEVAIVVTLLPIEADGKAHGTVHEATEPLVKPSNDSFLKIRILWLERAATFFLEFFGDEPSFAFKIVDRMLALSKAGDMAKMLEHRRDEPIEEGRVITLSHALPMDE